MVFFCLNEEGQGLVEYSLIILLVAFAVIGALTLLGSNVTAFFRNFANNF
ncbi:MAG: Flp family type IVb pilin [Clostridiales bacterium]|nr:Flp family type IVb pilin [Clostridiales bacterium]